MDSIIKSLIKKAIEDSNKPENIEIMKVVNGEKEISFK